MLYLYSLKNQACGFSAGWVSMVPKTFALQYFAWIVVDIDWPWNILWNDEIYFFSIDKLISTTVKFVKEKTFIISRNNHYILKKWQYFVILQPNLLLDLIFLSVNCKWNLNRLQHRVRLPCFLCFYHVYHARLPERFCNPTTLSAGYHFRARLCTSSHWPLCRGIDKIALHWSPGQATIICQ